MSLTADPRKEHQSGLAERIRAVLPVLFLSLALLTAGFLYSSTLNGGFIGDDYMHLDQAQTIRPWQHPLPALTKGVYYYFRPWPSLWWAGLYAAFGLHPLPYRLSNLALHLAIIFAFYRLGQRVLHDRTAAGLSSLLFAVFPLHGEAVAWTSANTDLWATLFAALCLERWLAWRDAEAPRSGTAAAMLGYGLMAYLSKEYTYLLPAGAALSEFLPGARRTGRQRLALLALLAGLAVLVLAVKFALALGQVLPPGLRPLSDWPHNMIQTLKVLLSPAGIPRFAHWATPLTLGLALGATLLALWNRLSPRAFLFGALFTIAFLFLPAAMGGVGPDHNFSRMFYLPSLGTCLALGSLFTISPREKSFPRRLKALLAGGLAGMFFLTAGVNLRPYLLAGRASRSLEQSFREVAGNLNPGDAVFVEGVPLILNGVWFFPNSYYLSVAFSMWGFPEIFTARGFDDRSELPVYAISSEAPEIEAKMLPLKRLRELKTAPVEAFAYRLLWRYEGGALEPEPRGKE
jgi:hypothetical protein